MAKKKKEIIEVEYPEFGFYVKDDFGVELVVESNSSLDKHKYLEDAKKLKRPIVLSIEAEIFDTYKFRNYGMTVEEAKNLGRELMRMVEYLEESTIKRGM